MSNEQTLAANRSVLEARWPVVWQRLSEAAFEGTLRWSDAAQPTLLAGEIHLSSAYDREREAALQARLISEYEEQAWVYGVGTGDLVRALLGRRHLKRLTVVVMNGGLFRAICAEIDFSDWLTDPRVELRLAEGERSVQTPFAAVPPCLQLASDTAAPLRDRVVLELATPLLREQHQGDNADVPDGINAVFRLDLAARLEQNAEFVAHDGDVSALFGAAQRPTVLVAGAGPTLSQHGAWLRDQRDRFVLIAVDAALRPLLNAGIVPDVVVTIDPTDTIARFFEGDLAPLAGRPLVYFPAVCAQVLERWPGPRLTAYADGAQHEGVRARWPKAALFSSGSVIHPAVDLAVRIGPRRIGLIGADFSYPGGRTHAAGVATASDVAKSASSLWVLNGHGERVPTHGNMRGYMRDLEDYMAQHPEVEFFNTSLDGAAIAGAPFRAPETWDDE